MQIRTTEKKYNKRIGKFVKYNEPYYHDELPLKVCGEK